MTEPDELGRAERDAEAEAEAANEAVGDANAEAESDEDVDRQALLDNDEVDQGLSPNDYTVAFSPKQVAVGLAIVAGLVALVAARRRRGRSSGDGGGDG